MYHHRISPAPSPYPTTPHSPSPSPFLQSQTQQLKDSKPPIDFSPPLIAMVVIILTAFVIITYSRFLSRHLIHNYRRYTRWRRHHRRRSSSTDIESPSFDLTDAFHVLSPYGLDDKIIESLPISIYTRKSGFNFNDCAVCLLEFDHNDYIRTLPVCMHAFHVDCIDIWLRSHANCPLCRAGIFRGDTPFTPLMAARIRPVIDDEIVVVVEGTLHHDVVSNETNVEHEIEIVSDERVNRRDFLLKRSYSFGFERNLGSERLVLEPVTASPWNRYRTRNGNVNGSANYWNRRNSPFGSVTKHRVFSFRYYRGIGMKSPFFRRRSVSGLYGGGGSSRRSNKSFASPMFMRPGNGGVFSSSRLRSGDPEALLSPERYRR